MDKDIRTLFLEFFAQKSNKAERGTLQSGTQCAQKGENTESRGKDCGEIFTEVKSAKSSKNTESSAQGANKTKGDCNGHKIYDSMPLVPEDASLLFTNAGMVQFKDIFTGKIPTPTPPRATSSQLCIRAGGKHNDLENVGYTARHHTLFEMLGNFSFGDYFKREAISFAWEFVTEVLKFDKSLLYVTVHTSDDEAYELWQEHIAPERIKKMGDKDNFWQMGDTGPCGPCSEIYIDQGQKYFNGSEDYFGGEGDRFLEIWNLVFMQYERDTKGNLTPLPHPSIDTGMGLERVYALKEGKINNYDTSLFAPLMACIENLTGLKYVRDDEVLDSENSVDLVDCHAKSSDFARNDKTACHTEHSEVSQGKNRDISAFSKPQYDNEKSVQTNGDTTNTSAGILDEKFSQRKRANEAHLGVRRNEASLRREDLSLKSQASFRVIADHARSVTFLLAQGVNFDKEGRGYVLRRILRRAVRHGYLLGLKKPFLYKVVDVVCESMGGHYGYLIERKSAIMEQCRREEVRFFETIEAGMELFSSELKKLHATESIADFCDKKPKSNKLESSPKSSNLDSGVEVLSRDFSNFGASGTGSLLHIDDQAMSEQSHKSDQKRTHTKRIFSGEVAFKLYDTYGFPLDLTQDMLRESGIVVDLAAFDKCMDAQKLRSKASWKGSGDEVKNGDFNALLSEFGENVFVGYESISAESRILALLDCSFKRADSLKSGEQGWVMLDKTPFYPESGGPVGDKGTLNSPINSSLSNHLPNPSAQIHSDTRSSVPHSQAEAIAQGTTTNTRILDSKDNGFGAFLAEVIDTKKFFGLNLSQVRVLENVKVGEGVSANVDSLLRAEIAKHHSATHLLHLALRQILGSHIAQAGSLVESNRLRFDFSHPNALRSEELEQIQDFVNARIWEANAQGCELMPINEAKAKGACALFGEKYGEEVRVISFGESIELCGGIHTHNTSDIGSFYIVKESGISSGVRRIEAVCGCAGYEYAKSALNESKQVRLALKNNNIIEAIEKLKQSAKQAKKGNFASGSAGDGLVAGNLSSKNLHNEQVNGVSLIVQTVEGASIADLKAMVDNAKNTYSANGGGVAILLFGVGEGRINIVAGVKGVNTNEMGVSSKNTKGSESKVAKNGGLKAGEWVKQVAQILGGNGGGRDDFAQAGVKIEGADSLALVTQAKNAIEETKKIAKSAL